MKKYLLFIFVAVALAFSPAQAGLESATYIADLVSSNPLGSDPKNQGDDHLRLLKSTLQATFPVANRAFNLTQAAEWSDTVAAETASRALVTADLGKILLVDPTSGAVTLTLPDPTVVLTGWGIVVKRSVTHANAVTIARFGAELLDGQAKNITLDIINDTVVLRTDGTDWFVWARSSFNESNLVLAGSANTYTLTTGRTLAAYYDGLEVSAEVNVLNTGASTLNVDTLGADAIEWPDAAAMAAGDLPLGAKATFRHDGTNWQLVTVTSPAKQIQNQTYIAFDDTGAADAYVITPIPAITAYVAYQSWEFKAANANTGASTMNVSALGTRNIFDNSTGAALTSGEILANGIYRLTDDGTQLLLMNSSAARIDVQTFTADGRRNGGNGLQTRWPRSLRRFVRRR